MSIFFPKFIRLNAHRQNRLDPHPKRKILSTRSTGRTKYYIPGGKGEGGETDAQTLFREIKEELDITIVPESINYVGTFVAQADSNAQGIEVQMTCYSANYTGTVAAAGEIAEVVWLSYSDREKVSEVDKLIFDYLKGENLLI